MPYSSWSPGAKWSKLSGAGSLGYPPQSIRVEGATHFFDRKLGELANALVQGLGLGAGGAA